MSGYVAIGMGAGAGIVGGRVNLVAGPIFAQIERERAEGPRYVEALRDANFLREEAYVRRFGIPRATVPSERAGGIPEGWFAR